MRSESVTRTFAASTLLLIALCVPVQQAQAQRLMEFYQRALESNPTLRTGELGVEQAVAQKDLALSKLLPQVSAFGNYSWNEFEDSGLPPRHYNGERSGFQAQQALLDLSAYFKLNGARFTVAQSEKLRQADRTTLAGDVVDRYLTVLQAADEIANLQSEEEMVDSQRRRLRFMRERELVKVTDLYEVEAYYQGLLTREIEARNAHAVALARLRELSGLKAEHVPPLAREAFAPVTGAEEQWVIDATLNNPTLMALQQAIEAAQMEIRSGRAEHSPRVALTVSKTHSNEGYDSRLVPAYTVGTIGVQITIPLYEGGRVQATVRSAAARFEMAREKYEGARREIERDTRTAYLNASTNQARIASTGDEVEALAKVVDAQQKSYELGVSTIVDVLIAQRRHFKSRSDRQKARYDYIRSFTLLRVRAGRLTDQDVAEIDGWMADRAPAQ
jgi:outer membrane protein